MRRWLGVILMAVSFVAAAGAPAFGQAKPEEKPAEKPKTLWEENTLFAYIENSWVWNTGRASRGNHNELRFYDFEGGYSFNVG